jgi:hypothetical protein
MLTSEHKASEPQYTMPPAVVPRFSSSLAYLHLQLKEKCGGAGPNIFIGYRMCRTKNKLYLSIADTLEK